MKNTAFLLDTNISALPIYEWLSKNFSEVYVVGGKSNDFLANYASKYLKLDYSNLSELKRIVSEIQPDAVFPGCNDVSFLSCSEVCFNTNLVNIDNSSILEIINNKKRFRDFCCSSGYPSPRVFEDAASISEFSGRLIIKPTDAFSGKGVTIVDCNDSESIATATSYARECSKIKQAVIEEFFDGQLYSHSAFIVNQKIVADFFVAENCNAYPFAVDTSYLVPLDIVDPTLLCSIRQSIERFSKELSLVDGLVHTQLIASGTDWRIVEITRRCPGDLYSELISMSTGFPYADVYASLLHRQCGSVPVVRDEVRPILRHTFTIREGGRFAGLTFNVSERLKRFYPMQLSGVELLPAPAGRVAVGFFEFDTLGELIECTKRIEIRTFVKYGNGER